MKKIIFCLIIILVFLGCEKKETPTGNILKPISNNDHKIDSLLTYQENGKKDFEIKLVDGKKSGVGYLYNNKDEIAGFRTYENDKRNGSTLLLNEQTKMPKYLIEFNNDKADGVFVEFYNNGGIKSFRNADILHDGQVIEFHENGVIKEFGNTIRGSAHGIWLYFDTQGMLEKKVEYDHGSVK